MKRIDINTTPPPSTCSQQVTDEKATTPANECLEQTEKLIDGLVTVEEIQELDDEGEVNTLTDELKTEKEIVENSSNFEEDFLGDFPILMDNLANVLSMEVRHDYLLQTEHLCLTNNEALRSDYNDPFLQPSSKPENARFVVNNTLSFSTKLGKKTKSNPLKIEVDPSLLIS